MLIKYSYLDYNNTDRGTFQTDTEDFKKFFARYQRQIQCLVAHLQDGRVYIWQNPMTCKKTHHKGWQLIKSK